MKKTSVKLLLLLLVYLCCIGCSSVSVVSDAPDYDLSAVIPVPDNPNNYIDIIRYASVPTDKGLFHIVREDDADYVSFLTNEGEDIRLLKGCRFVNLQVIQPYLYVVDTGTRQISPRNDCAYAKLYRLDLSDRSVSCFPRYTIRYYALSSGEILRVCYLAGCYKLYLSDWQDKNSCEVFSYPFAYNPLHNPLPQGDSVEWVYFDHIENGSFGYSTRLMRFSADRHMEESESVWYTKGEVYSKGIYTFDNRKYCIEDIPDYTQSARPHAVTVYLMSEDSSRALLCETEYRWQSDDPALFILPERAADCITDSVHPNVIIRESLENGLCLFGIASNHEIKIYTFDNLVSYYDVDDGTETLISLDTSEQN